MLQLSIAASEQYDEANNLFISLPEETLQLEHSLVSLSKWEEKHCVPFLSKEGRTVEESVDYIRCMTLNPNVDPAVYDRITDFHMAQVSKYIEAPMTATTVTQDPTLPGSKEIITSELIYCWLTLLSIPFEVQYWHLNRLLMLVKVCNAKNTPPKKGKRQDILKRNATLNEARRKALNTKG